MKTVYILACVYMAIVTDIVYADPISVVVASRGETVLYAASGTLKVQVKIKTHEIEIGGPRDQKPANAESNCTYSRNPCSIVDRIEITVNGTELFVPRSVFSDLADLDKAEVTVSKKKSVLRLDAGEASASESYIVKVEFDAMRVTRRTVAGGESPNLPSEETTYHVVVFN